MKKKLSSMFLAMLSLFMVFTMAACGADDLAATTVTTDSAQAELAIDGSYTTKEDVALYIHTYGCLPSNFMTKKEAQQLGFLFGHEVRSEEHTSELQSRI